MKIAILNTWPYGSTGSVALTLAHSLAELGHETCVAVGDKLPEGADSLLVKITPPSQRALFVKRAMRKTLADRFWKSEKEDPTFIPEWRFGTPSAAHLLAQLPFKPDAVIALWTDYFASFSLLAELHKLCGCQVVVYMMDMAVITGGCHYAYSCRGYEKQCGHCPAIKSRKENDMSRRQWQARQAAVASMSPIIVSPSGHCSDQIKAASIWKGARMARIPIAISPKDFPELAQSAARQSLGLPSDARVLFFGAQHLHEKRKGMQLLLDALSRLKGMDFPVKPFLAYAGGSALPGDLPFESRHMGYLDRKALATMYRAADAFVCPSIEDSGPLMINESIMSGTPVVCFDMGVGKDLVVSGETGYRARLGDVEDLACGLRSVLCADAEGLAKLREGCRAMAESRLTPAAQAHAFAAALERGEGLESL
ncbi:MAG: glycosyltransferase [Armatimonadetes bacterium]|nr:glycosyltransferase [Armatimonadota bacterium]